ncbi:MAG: transglycosylase domain-containing protein [Chloroflexota bacterium]|nr:transglycosylase domain-containing protein [Chloroflexota bacterium]
MGHGRIARANQRYPSARRRAARYGRTPFGRRPNDVPLHLIGGGISRQKPGGLITSGRLLIVAGTTLLAILLAVLVMTVISTVAGVSGTMAAYEEVNANLPDAGQISVDTFQTTKIYDRNGVLLQEVDNPEYGWRTFVPLDQISPYFIDATVAAEDATFWTNQGVEPIAIVRGAFIYASGAGTSGGSTITQQLTRSLYPEEVGFDISLTRKGKEALAAYALAQRYSKNDILTMYVNRIYYGSRAYGVEAAAQTFFNKHAKDLTLAEASLLAGLPQAPSAYDPSDQDKFGQAKIRQEYVLDQMVKYRYLTRAEAKAAFNEPLQIRDSRSGAMQAAPHFTDYVRSYIVETYGEDALYGGLEITTSIDLDLQAAAEQIVARNVAELAVYDRNNAAMVVMVPWSGEVLAMVGSADWTNQEIGGQVNYATAQLQPGSSIKPVVYAAAFEKGWNPATRVMDVPVKYDTPDAPDPTYEPQNYTGRFYGAVTVRTALSNSLNISAVKATEYVGIDGVIDMSRRMGIKHSLNDRSIYGLSLGLGAGEVQLLEHTNVYATFANNGTHVPVHPIREIKDSQGNVLFKLDAEQVKKESTQAMKAGFAYQITSILSDDKSRELVFGRGNLFASTQAALGRPTAAKSGTTENWKDLWTMGYTSDVAIGAWVGKSGGDTSNLPKLDGSQAAGPIWRDMMIEIHQNPTFAALLKGPNGQVVPEEFAKPADIYQGDVCGATGNQPGRGQSAKEVLVRGESPTRACGDLNDFERRELEKALAAARTGRSQWASGAIASINNYASAAGARGAPIPQSDQQTQPGQQNQSTQSTQTQTDPNAPIQPNAPLDSTTETDQIIEPLD